MVKPRQRTDQKTEQEIAAFAALAEQPAPYIKAVPESGALPSEPLPQPEPAALEQDDADQAEDPAQSSQTKPKVRRKGTPSPSDSSSFDAAWKRRNREKKTTGLNFRASGSQMELLQLAAIHEEVSMQKILERLVWPVLEERYGKVISS